MASDHALDPGVTPHLSARGVSKVFAGLGPGVLALHDVDLEVAHGEFLSLLGPTGCGKSTLLRILGGLETASEGAVASDGLGPGHGAAFVFQDYSLFPWLTVLDNVAFGLRMQGVARGERRERAAGWLTRVGLGGFEGAYPEQLSGGMRQRISLARAFVTEPEVLLMDEPMGAVDAQTRLLLQEDLMRLWEATRKTVVLVTHSIEEALLLGDRVVVMSARPGRITLELPVSLPRPRTQETTTTEAFGEMKAVLWDALRDEVAESMTQS